MNIRNRSAEVKPMRKILPYSIKPIGGAEELLVWKREQAEKQSIWDAGKAGRYIVAKERAVTGLLYGDGKLSEADIREIEAVKALNAKVKPTYVSQVVTLHSSQPKISLITSIYNKLITWFSTINFEPKG